ncbi:MAG: hypothetical protein NPIRA06_07710 [Nitrospirales bacterium]|nr:MAG: hypothetical protein NPIRA06_07710 [Nitrospirales bacterium]
MIGFVIRHLVLPHAENDLQPFRPQRSQCVVVLLPPGAILLKMNFPPFTVFQQLKGQLPNRLPEVLVAWDTEPDLTTFPTLRRSLAQPKRDQRGRGWIVFQKI